MAAIAGTKLGEFITAGDTDASFATHVDIYGQGGLMSFSNLANVTTAAMVASPFERLSPARQKQGMLLFNINDTTYYSLTSVSNTASLRLAPIFKLNSDGSLVINENVGIYEPNPGDRDRLTVNGNISANGTIKLSEGTTSAKGLQFHTDVNLYRSAANTLKTDDEFVVGTLNSSTSNSVVVETGGKLEKRTLNSNTFDTTATFLSGSPTVNRVLKLISLNRVGDSIIHDDGTNVGINNTSPNSRLTVNGNISATGKIFVSTIDTDTTSNSVIVDVNTELEKRTINSRVWDTNNTFLSGSPTTNTILKLDSLNRVGNSNITQDISNRIGIGTSTPSPNHLLTVIGGISGTTLDIANIGIFDNTIRSTNANSGITIITNGGDLVLGTNGNGVVTLRSQRFPTTIGENNQALRVTDKANNQLGWVTTSYFTLLTSNVTPSLIPSSVGLAMSGLPNNRSYLNSLLPNKIYNLGVSFLETGIGTSATAKLMLSGNTNFSIITGGTILSQNSNLYDITNGYPFINSNIYIITNTSTNCVIGISALSDSTFIDTLNLGSSISFELLT